MNNSLYRELWTAHISAKDMGRGGACMIQLMKRLLEFSGKQRKNLIASFVFESAGFCF